MLADSFDKGRTMANDKKTIPTFNHIQNSAPEYVEVILWRRVVLALGTLVLALGGTGFLLFGWMQESGGNGDMEVVTMPVESISPDQLEAPAAIPARDDVATNTTENSPASDNLPTSVADQPEIAGVAAQPVPTQSNDPAAPAAEKPAIAAKSTHPAPTAGTAANTQLALLEQSKPAIKKIQTTLQPATTGDRHQVQTDILMPAVKRAVLTTVMRGREPGKPLQSTNGLSLASPLSLHQFIELKGRAGDTLTYTWKRDGKVVTRVQVNVGGDQIGRAHV